MQKKLIIIVVGLFFLIGGSFVFGKFLPKKETSGAAPKSGLVGYWSMDANDINGTTVYDKSGNNNHGTGVNIAAGNLRQGKTKQALYFDGTGDYITANTINPSDPHHITMSAWIKKTTFTAEGGVYTDSVLFKGNDVSADSYGISTAAPSGGAWSSAVALVQVNTDDGAVQQAGSGAGSLSPNTWHHIIGVIDGQNLYIYVDGILKGQDTFTGTLSASANTFWIGRQNRATYSYDFEGQIDDARIYGRVLSASEITQLYNSTRITHINTSDDPVKVNYTASAPKDGLVGYWNMDAGDVYGTTIYDKSGSNNNGSGTNITSADIVKGKIKQAFDFDGSSEYITATEISAYNSTNISVAAWVKFDVTTGYQGVVTKRSCVWNGSNCQDAISYQWSMQTNNDNKIVFGVTTNTGTLGAVAQSNATTGWELYMGTFDGETVTLYRNGEYEYSRSNSGSIIVQSGIPVVIGARANNTSPYTDRTDYTNGKIDDVRIYNRTLSAAEVSQLYEATRKIYVR